MARWGHIDRERTWLATTDAYSQVPEQWLARLAAHHDAGVGADHGGGERIETR